MARWLIVEIRPFNGLAAEPPLGPGGPAAPQAPAGPAGPWIEFTVGFQLIAQATSSTQARHTVQVEISPAPVAGWDHSHSLLASVWPSSEYQRVPRLAASAWPYITSGRVASHRVGSKPSPPREAA